MTKEEAIFCEKSYIGETNCIDCKYYGTDTCQSRESHKMAIKALEQMPCEDAISRKAVLDCQQIFYNYAGHKIHHVDIEDIKNLPPVYPQNTDVLDKIRADIEQVAEEESKHDRKWSQGLKYALKIIDKYRGKQNE